MKEWNSVKALAKSQLLLDSKDFKIISKSLDGKP